MFDGGLSREILNLGLPVIAQDIIVALGPSNTAFTRFSLFDWHRNYMAYNRRERKTSMFSGTEIRAFIEGTVVCFGLLVFMMMFAAGFITKKI